MPGELARRGLKAWRKAMEQLLVIGSGASGVHFAQAALERGHEVTLLDIGRPPTPVVLPQSNFAQLKDELPDAVDYFLGSDYGATLLPGNQREYYGIPPSKDYVFDGAGMAAPLTQGF